MRCTGDRITFLNWYSRGRYRVEQLKVTDTGKTLAATNSQFDAPVQAMSAFTLALRSWRTGSGEARSYGLLAGGFDICTAPRSRATRSRATGLTRSARKSSSSAVRAARSSTASAGALPCIASAMRLPSATR